MTSIRSTIAATITTMKSWMAENDQSFNESKRQAHDWERHPNPIGHCEVHGCATFHDLAKVAMHLPEEACYTCWQCEKTRRDNEIEQTRIKRDKALFPNSGDYLAGLDMLHARANLQEKALRNLFNVSPTIHIERGNTEPRIEISDIPTGKLAPNPLTPLPETRAELFSDSLILWNEAEEDEDITEIRRRTTTPRIAAPTTQKIPTIGAEVILEHMAYPERVTGEQEPVKHWML